MNTRGAIARLTIPRGMGSRVDPRSPGPARVGPLAYLEIIATALAYWTRFPVPELSSSRAELLPIGASTADDPGLYWLVPHIPTDPAHAVWLLSLVAFAIALAWQRTWATRLVLALTAPVFIAPGAAYWVPAFAVWMALPASPRTAGVIAVLVAPFRGVAALPALASAFRSPKTGIAAVAALLLVTAVLGSHLFWHTIYIGLGWGPNPWGIQYLDAFGAAASSAPYASAQYEADLRGLVIAHVLEQPGWFVGQLAAKLGAAIMLGFPWVLALPIALWRRPALVWPLLAAMVPMLMAVPLVSYATGFFAVMAFTFADGVAAAVSRRRVPAVVPQRLEAIEVFDVAGA